MMELWASGFNAWGQLDFEGVSETAPRDLKEFKCILKDESIKVVRTTLSATLVKTSSGFRTAGQPDDLIQHCINKQDSLSNLALAGNDKVAFRYRYPRGPYTEPMHEELEKSKANFGIGMKQYRSFNFYLKDDVYADVYHYDGVLKMVVANQCMFTALSAAGEVRTWGDGRYEACFGREISGDSPAWKPSVVEDLSDLPTGPIKKISSGGYMTAAVTAGNDLYIWGGQPGEPKILDDLTGDPTPVDIEGGDIIDVTVGMNHILALTTDYKLFVVGDGSNGQLGLDMKKLTGWKEVVLPLENNQRITSVYTGYKNSMVIVENVT